MGIVRYSGQGQEWLNSVDQDNRELLVDLVTTDLMLIRKCYLKSCVYMWMTLWISKYVNKWMNE